MPSSKNACIVYVESDGCDPSTTKAQLEESGYQVTLLPVSADEVKEIKEGDYSALSKQQIESIQNSTICVILISECTGSSGAVGSAIGCAINAAADIIGIWPKGKELCPLPPNLLDYADDIIPEDSLKLPRIIAGDDTSWEGPDGEQADAAKKKNQEKC